MAGMRSPARSSLTTRSGAARRSQARRGRSVRRPPVDPGLRRRGVARAPLAARAVAVPGGVRGLGELEAHPAAIAAAGHRGFRHVPRVSHADQSNTCSIDWGTVAKKTYKLEHFA